MIQRLLSAITFGRNVDMAEVLSHELSTLPSSLATADGKMRSTGKSSLLSILAENIDILDQIPDSDNRTCYIIDGHALIQSLQKPSNCKTFGDYANTFINIVMSFFKGSIFRVDVIFDRYLGDMSIKSFTREERNEKKRPIRKNITSAEVPLPESWDQYICSDDNKADLAAFLSDYMTTIDVEEQFQLVTSGGFKEETEVWSSNSCVDGLRSNHEEADTRMILHAKHGVDQGIQRIIVASADTDVMILLLHFIAPIAEETWMASRRERKMYPLHHINKYLMPEVVANLPGYHALTGCDTTSSFLYYAKSRTWETYLNHPQLLDNVGRDDDNMTGAEQYVLNLYKSPQSSNLNMARLDIFNKGKTELERLPPTQDAFQLHLARANYQANVWYQATTAMMIRSKPEDTVGWSMTEDQKKLNIVWTRIPAMSKSTFEIVTCGCTKKCGNNRCKCVKNNVVCIPACGCCAQNCLNPCNVAMAK